MIDLAEVIKDLKRFQGKSPIDSENIQAGPVHPLYQRWYWIGQCVEHLEGLMEQEDRLRNRDLEQMFAETNPNHIWDGKEPMEVKTNDL